MRRWISCLYVMNMTGNIQMDFQRTTLPGNIFNSHHASYKPIFYCRHEIGDSMFAFNILILIFIPHKRKDFYQYIQQYQQLIKVYTHVCSVSLITTWLSIFSHPLNTRVLVFIITIEDACFPKRLWAQFHLYAYLSQCSVLDQLWKIHQCLNKPL